jgi:hypothetical protein
MEQYVKKYSNHQRYVSERIWTYQNVRLNLIFENVGYKYFRVTTENRKIF